MKIKENAVEALTKFTEEEKLIRVLDALKVGVEKDNLVIVDTFLQNVLNQLFLEVAKTVEAEDSDFKENNQKTESIKKFLKGDDKRFGVGLDLVCNYLIKSKKLWFNFQGLSVNENANAIKFFEDKELEYSSSEETKDIYNSIIDGLNKFYSTDVLDSIKL
ncbi:MAG: hypothetical protein K6A63_03035 [Acholeplasmatales bacterium]|nr:hypothetical protein [Acholeplasmatales bacterium]